MSVRVGDRGEGKLQVLNLSKQLCEHTMTMCKSETRFPKRQRWLLTQRIANEAVEAHACIRRANATLLKQSPTIDIDFAYRHAQQTEAHAHIGALLALIDIAGAVAKSDGRKLDGREHWVRLAVDTDAKLKAWTSADTKRYLSLKDEV